MSGKTIHMKPRRAAGINEIESMASAVQRRMNAMDFSGPRMVNGWDACGNCDYKLLCFDGEGIMQRYNLPLSGRISLADDLINEMSQQLRGYTEEQKEIGIDFARVFLPFITQNPGMTKDGYFCITPQKGIIQNNPIPLLHRFLAQIDSF